MPLPERVVRRNPQQTDRCFEVGVNAAPEEQADVAGDQRACDNGRSDTSEWVL